MINLNKAIGDVQQYKGEELFFDPDSSPEAIKYFETIYKNHLNLYNEFDFSHIEHSSNQSNDANKKFNRLKIQLAKNSIFRNDKNKPFFEISGDCDFNFNDKKIELFQKIIKPESTYYDKLIEFNKKHHTLINMSLMPTTGAMNNFKGFSDSFDGLDKFLYNLNNFYNKVNENVLSLSTKNNKTYLKIFLNTFEDIFDYCNQIYFINDKNLIISLIFLGCLRSNFSYSSDTEIQCKEKEAILILYMNLVEKYWQEKEKNINKHLEKITK